MRKVTPNGENALRGEARSVDDDAPSKAARATVEKCRQRAKKKTRRIRALIHQGQLSNAQERLDALENEIPRIKFLKLWSEMAFADGSKGDGIAYLEEILSMNPNDNETQVEYVKKLGEAGSLRKMLDFTYSMHSDSPNWLKLVDHCYEKLGWRGHVGARRNCSIVRHPMRWLLRNTIDVVLFRLESAENGRLGDGANSIAVLQGLKFESSDQRITVNEMVDRAVISRGRLETRRTVTGHIATVCSLVLAISVALVITAIRYSPTPAWVFLAVAAFTSGMYLLAGKLWSSARTVRGSAIRTGAFGLLVAAFGVYIMRAPQAPRWVDYVGLGLFSGSLAVMLGTVANATAEIAYQYRIRRHRRFWPRELVLHELALIVHGTQCDKSWSSPYTPYRWLLSLAKIAETVEFDFAREIDSTDCDNRDWLNQRLRLVAEDFRHLACQVALPATHQRGRFVAHLRQQLNGLAANNWSSLRYRKSERVAPIGRRKKMEQICRRLGAAAVPAIAVGVIELATDPGPAFTNWGVIVVLAWPALYLLVTLDPGVGEKIALAREIVGAASQGSPDGRGESRASQVEYGPRNMLPPSSGQRSQ